MGLWVDTFTVPTHFFINLLLRASLAHFPHLYIFWALLANIPAVPAHFTTSFFGLSCPIYFFFTSFTLMCFLLDSSGFLGPITTSLPLLGFVSQHSCCASPFHYFIPQASSAYLLLLISFTPMGFLLNFLGFLGLITTSLPLLSFVGQHFYSHGRFARFFGFPWPNYHIFTSYYFSSLLAFKPPQWVY